MGQWMYRPFFLDFGTSWVRFALRPLYPLGKYLCPLRRRLDGPQSRTNSDHSVVQPVASPSSPLPYHIKSILQNICLHSLLREMITIKQYTTLSSCFIISKLLMRRMGLIKWYQTKNKQTLWPQSAWALYLPKDRRLSAKLVPTFADRECHVVSVTGFYGRILSFLDQSRYLFFQVALQLYSRGWVDPVPDPLLLRKSCSAGNRTRTSPETLTTKPQRRSTFFYIAYINSVRTSQETQYSRISVV
jgi:hypothetical protein